MSQIPWLAGLLFVQVQLVTQGAFGLFLGKGVASRIQRSLHRLGVEIMDHTTVAAVRAQSVVSDQGNEIACDLCVWTGGCVAPALACEAGLAVNEHNQVIVDPFLRSISHPEIYAIGFINYPNDRPNPPYISGWLGYQIREGFVRYLATAPQLERRWPGFYMWLGKQRYRAARRRQKDGEKEKSMQLHQA
jgi:pyridine nucleotide-disulfide oxidoreductase